MVQEGKEFQVQMRDRYTDICVPHITSDHFNKEYVVKQCMEVLFTCLKWYRKQNHEKQKEWYSEN